MKYNILIVDDEENILTSLELALRKNYNVFCAENGQKALKIFSENNIPIVFLDLTLQDIDGITVLKRMKKINSAAEIVIITANTEIATAVSATKYGAYDYVTKPYEISKLMNLAEKIIEKTELEKEVAVLKSHQQTEREYDSLIGESGAVVEINRLIGKLFSSMSTVLITGESGTGKEVVAKAIHYSGKYKDKPFVPVHTGAISEGIVESELFGHEQGAFTGANSRKIGKFEYANGGTIFLDEISTMNQSVQVKLLRVLQDKTFCRVGSSVPITVDVRILAATNIELEAEVRNGRFREDLFYRLKVFCIHIPPLRERTCDVKPLAEMFLRRYCREFQKDVKGFSDEAMKALMQYNWPGNVRELKNIIERTVVLIEKDMIGLEDLPMDLSVPDIQGDGSLRHRKETKKEISRIEREYIKKVLKNHNWNKGKAARAMGIHRNTLSYKMKKFNIKKELQ